MRGIALGDDERDVDWKRQIGHGIARSPYLLRMHASPASLGSAMARLMPVRHRMSYLKSAGSSAAVPQATPFHCFVLSGK